MNHIDRRAARQIRKWKLAIGLTFICLTLLTVLMSISPSEEESQASNNEHLMRRNDCTLCKWWPATTSNNNKQQQQQLRPSSDDGQDEEEESEQELHHTQSISSSSNFDDKLGDKFNSKLDNNSDGPARARPRVRLLCAILTWESDNNKAKRSAVEKTWAKRCDKHLMVEGENDTSKLMSIASGGGGVDSNTKVSPVLIDKKLQPAAAAAGDADAMDASISVELNNTNTLLVPLKREARVELWHKVARMFEFLYANYLNDFDWFMKADDDTYLLVDSLRKFLISKSSPKEPIYFGHKFKPYVKQGYMSGGSGYVLSREALRRLVEDGFKKRLPQCDLKYGSVEDVEIGKCLEAVGVIAGDTRDALGRETFLPLTPQDLLQQDNPLDRGFWYFEYNFYGSSDSGETTNTDNKNYKYCSNEPMAFHYISPREMYLIDWLLYDVRRTTGVRKRRAPV